MTARVSESNKSQFYGQLALETARARISFNGNAQLSDIIISKHFPTTNELSESAIIEGLTQVWQSTVVVWNTIALRLSIGLNLRDLGIDVSARACAAYLVLRQYANTNTAAPLARSTTSANFVSFPFSSFSLAATPPVAYLCLVRPHAPHCSHCIDCAPARAAAQTQLAAKAD